jgi:glucose-1-phosphate adenylyltransferase
MSQSLVMIMAGGKGSRLGPLTCHRAKPATPFGGRYRIIDFVLSNFVNSGYGQIHILTQYMAGSLIRHLNRTWHLSGYDQYIELAPAQMRRGEFWYRGTADSIYQNMNLIHDSGSEHIAVFGGDHIYKCAIDQMETFHRDMAADLTIAAFPVPRNEAHEFGVMQVDEHGRVIGFQEKPADPTPIPGQPDTCLVSMGNYFFRSDVLEESLLNMVKDPDTHYDFGKDIIPQLLAQGAKVCAYDFRNNHVRGDPLHGQAYWRDVGTIDSYFKACMELRSPVANLNLYNREWRIQTAQRNHPPARFISNDGDAPVDLDDCMVCEGAVVQGAKLVESIIGYDCQIHTGARVTSSLLMSGSSIGRGSVLNNVLVDKNCVIAPGAEIGIDPVADARRFPFRTVGGVTVLPKGTVVPVNGPIEFAADIGPMLFADKATKDQVAGVELTPLIAKHTRHSYRSAGPGTS